MLLRKYLQQFIQVILPPGFQGGLQSYMGYIGMCCCEGYGFQAVYSSIGYINQSVKWVQNIFHETDQLIEDFI